MKVLLFGGSGQLGVEIRARAREHSIEVLCPVSSEVNIVNRLQVDHLLDVVKPDVVINSAAYTAVDKAEEEVEKAFEVNKQGAENIARAGASVGAKVIYISTDYVFHGAARDQVALREDEDVDPRSVYGKSKLAGERATLEFDPDNAVVLRTASLFGKKGPNFVQTMIRLFKEEKNLKIVKDQRMSPTWAGWLAEAVIKVAKDKTASGIYHASSGGDVSWYEFAEEILFQLQQGNNKGLNASIEPTTAAAYSRPAPRPSYSVLDCSKLEQLLGEPVMSWKASLYSYFHDVGLKTLESVDSKVAL